MSGFFFCRQRKLFQVHVGSSLVKEKLRKWCFIWAWLWTYEIHSSTAGAWSLSLRGESEPSVGIKQTLQQTCFTRKRKLRSKFWWLTRFCNSHDVSHFAAFFIVVGAKTSVAESGLTLRSFAVESHCRSNERLYGMSFWSIGCFVHSWLRWVK